MPDTLVIRFGSLGDLCLLGWALAGRGDQPAPGRTVLVTKPVYRDLAARFRGVDEVVVPDGTSAVAVARLGRKLAARPFTAVIDAHNVLRGHLLLAAMGRRPDRRLAKDTAARLALLQGAGPDPKLQRTMVDRFVEVLAPPGTEAVGPAAIPPLAAVDRPAPAPGEAILGLAPGAQWDTKRWPAGRFAELIDSFLEVRPGRAHIFLGPREEAWFAGSDLGRFADHRRVRIFRDLPLTTVADELARCAAIVTNDSGLLHLAEAVGTPVVALFGPTVRAFGYFPRLPDSRVVARDLDCRPCSRNGKRPCHRGDLACLRPITAGEVWPLVAAILDNTRSRS